MTKGKVKLTEKTSDMQVITIAKDLCTYIMTVTQKSPKQFRFTFVSRLQNLSLNIIENLYRANETFIADRNSREQIQKRLDFQHAALTDLKLLGYFGSVALEQHCILLKQFQYIAKLITECEWKLGAWINADRKRFGRVSK